VIYFNDRPRASRPFFLLFLALALALLTAYVVSPGIVLGLVILAALVLVKSRKMIFAALTLLKGSLSHSP
jgi:hypothetical protein